MTLSPVIAEAFVITVRRKQDEQAEQAPAVPE
jgi:hypothetical protein